MGFAWDDKRLRRAGWTITSLPPLRVIMTIARFSKQKIPSVCLPSHEGTPTAHSAVSYQDGDYLMFGPETRTPASILDAPPAEQKFVFQWCRTAAAHEPVQCGVGGGV